MPDDPPVESASGIELAHRLRRRLTLVNTGFSVVGVGIVVAYFVVVFPPPEEDASFASTELFTAVALVYLVLTTLWGNLYARRLAAPVEQWLASGGATGETGRRGIFAMPWRLAALEATHWLMGIPIFFLIGLDYSLQFATEVAMTIALGGLITSSAVYLASERVGRPATALALSDSPEAESCGACS
jgi:hypothetical protein